MKKHLTITALAVAGIAAAPSSPVTALAGRYSAHFKNGLISGERYFSDDVAEIVPVDASHAYVRFALQFANGHSCSLAGVAKAKGDSLVYVEPAGKMYGDVRCTLTIARHGAKLAWDDNEGSCRTYCGARGSFIHDDLPWSSKRAITYLPRLKASRQYRDALTEWHTGKSQR